jgi:hypothetical protein
MAGRSDIPEERYRKRREREDAHRKQLPGAYEEPLPPAVDPIRSDAKPRRNALCPCGSGKKYKHCCGKK